MAGRISPGGQRKNVFGVQLRRMRVERELSAVEVVTKLGVLGWDVPASSYSQIESGQRIIGDVELLLILKVLGSELSDLAVPAKYLRKK